MGRVQDEKPDLIWHKINDEQIYERRNAQTYTHMPPYRMNARHYFVSGKEDKYLRWKLNVEIVVRLEMEHIQRRWWGRDNELLFQASSQTVEKSSIQLLTQTRLNLISLMSFMIQQKAFDLSSFAFMNIPGAFKSN
jgi:hypothetical protein